MRIALSYPEILQALCLPGKILLEVVTEAGLLAYVITQTIV